MLLEQGRRLRHSNAEAKLRDWESKQKERELEKIALVHIKKQEREAKREAEKQVGWGCPAFPGTMTPKSCRCELQAAVCRVPLATAQF